MPNPDQRTSAPWPEPLAKAAYHGIAGEWLRRIAPNTEADPAALLFQLLPAIGNVIGRAPHFRAEGDRHYTALNAVIVGQTSKGRKGTSEGRVRQLLLLIDSHWAKHRIKSGLASGEGLVYEVRDASNSAENPDPGVSDKRLLVTEPEFARVFSACERVGSTLSPTIRQAWDCPEVLAPLTKTSRCKATKPHISILAHITRAELKRKLSEAEEFNGFANRFLWACSRRSQCLPEGGLDVELSDIAVQISEAVTFAKTVREMKRSAAARDLWAKIYPELSEGKPGLFGAVTSRAEAQVMRIAMIYALLDESAEIYPVHLKSALAVWQYNLASCRWIFGDALGDPMADEILRELRRNPDGLTRTKLRDHFGRNKTAEQIGRALSVLAEYGLAQCFQEKTEGRPVEIWKCTR